jgi:hypothetical protein
MQIKHPIRFWQDVYLTSLRVGHSAEFAKAEADKAVDHFVNMKYSATPQGQTPAAFSNAGKSNAN